MQVLATEIWERNNSIDSELCRVQWVMKQCVKYFNSDGGKNAIEKESKLSKRYMKDIIPRSFICSDKCQTLKLLDVGSCYNPFSKFSMFDVTAIDLMPASDNVYKCDFLSVIISSEARTIINPCTTLPICYFEVVVFSLLLEYFPSSKQRFKCCKNAYDVLKENGLLFIITPDSKHASANSRMMKSWRYALASLGFWRTSYEKLKHLHCMSYRKCIQPQVAERWLSTQQYKQPVEELLYIPQDFHAYSNVVSIEERNEERSEDTNKLLAETFSVLPDCDIFS